MNATTYTTARRNLAAVMDRVCDGHEPCIITRANGKQAVLVSQEDYEEIIRRCTAESEEKA